MKDCPQIEELALYAGGELDSGSASRVAAHVRRCAVCEKLCAEFGEDAALLRTRPEIQQQELVEVRAGVLAKIAARSRWNLVGLGVGIAAALAIAVLLPWAKFGREPKSLPLQSALRKAPPRVRQAVAALATEAPKPNAVRAKTMRKIVEPPLKDPDLVLAELEALLEEPEAPAARAYSGTVVVRLETRDPNVSIVLLESNTGDME
jgi:hypothetical protein